MINAKKHRMKKLLFVTLQLIFSISGFCQSNFKPATITLSNGSLINGLIDDREWIKNPRIVRFMKDENSPSEKFTTKDLISFQIKDGDFYIKAIVQKDMRPVEVSKINNDLLTTDSVETDTVFLRKVNACPEFELYVLTDIKNHFYIKEANGEFEELIYRVYISENRNNDVLVYKRFYRNQLEKYIYGHADNSTLKKKLESLDYDEQDLSAFVKLLSSEKNTTNIVKKEKSKPVFFISAGIIYSSLKITGSMSLADHHFSSKQSPTASVGMDLFSKRNLGDLIFRTEISYFGLNFSSHYSRPMITTPSEENFNLRSNNIKPSVSLLYSFIRNANYKIYAGVELGYVISSYKKNEFTKTNDVTNEPSTYNNYMACLKSWTTVSVKAGYIFNKKFEIKASGLIAGTFANYVNINVHPQIYDLQLVYRFTK